MTVNRQTWRACKRAGHSVFGEKVFEIKIRTMGESFHALIVSGEKINFCEGFHHEARVKVVHKVSFAVHGVRPGTIGILAFKDEVQIALRDFKEVPVSE